MEEEEVEEEAVEEVTEEEVKGHSRQPGGQHPGDMSTGGRRRGRLPLSLSRSVPDTGGPDPDQIRLAQGPRAKPRHPLPVPVPRCHLCPALCLFFPLLERKTGYH